MDGGPRIAAILGQLREAADEIVVAADSRADEERVRHYVAAADVVHRIEMGDYSRHLDWLHAQCSGEWILRVDGDEVLSAGLLAELPTLTAARDVEQYMLPRRWLFPDPGHWLEELPWWPDYQVRLVRNSGLLRFSGLHHQGPVPLRPARFLDSPIYHLALLNADVEGREPKMRAYDELLPGLSAPGGGPLNQRFYLPERYATTAPRPVPEEDAVLVRRVLDAEPLSHAKAPPAPSLPVVPLVEAERLWALREVGPGAYRAEIAAFEAAYRMAPGERRELYFRVTNSGTEHWSWDPDLKPLIRASYRWHRANGRAPRGEGPRTPFPCTVWPADSVILPLDVVAPDRAGSYMLEVDLVHDPGRWFETPLRVPVAVG